MPSDVYGQCPYCGGSLTMGHNCSQRQEATKQRESKRERALRLAVKCGILQRTPNGSMPAARFSIDEVERLISLIRAEAFEEAAKVCNCYQVDLDSADSDDAMRCAKALRRKAKEERDDKN